MRIQVEQSRGARHRKARCRLRRSVEGFCGHNICCEKLSGSAQANSAFLVKCTQRLGHLAWLSDVQRREFSFGEHVIAINPGRVPDLGSLAPVERKAHRPGFVNVDPNGRFIGHTGQPARQIRRHHCKGRTGIDHQCRDSRRTKQIIIRSKVSFAPKNLGNHHSGFGRPLVGTELDREIVAAQHLLGSRRCSFEKFHHENSLARSGFSSEYRQSIGHIEASFLKNE